MAVGVFAAFSRVAPFAAIPRNGARREKQVLREAFLPPPPGHPGKNRLDVQENGM